MNLQIYQSQSQSFTHLTFSLFGCSISSSNVSWSANTSGRWLLSDFNLFLVIHCRLHLALYPLPRRFRCQPLLHCWAGRPHVSVSVSVHCWLCSLPQVCLLLTLIVCVAHLLAFKHCSVVYICNMRQLINDWQCQQSFVDDAVLINKVNHNTAPQPDSTVNPTSGGEEAHVSSETSNQSSWSNDVNYFIKMAARLRAQVCVNIGTSL